MTIFSILKKHGITNPVLNAELQGFVTSKELESFENGKKQATATQANLESKEREKFYEEL